MSFQKFKTDSYCVGGRHRSSTTKIYGDITSKGSKVLIGYCSVCNRKKSMTVCDNTIKNLGKISSKAGKKLAKNVISNPGKALVLTAKIATAVATKSPKAALSTLPEVINFYHTGRGVFLGKFI